MLESGVVHQVYDVVASPSFISGFMTTPEDCACRLIAERYEDIMSQSLLQIMKLLDIISISDLSICSHRTKVIYENKMRRLFGVHQ